MLAYDRDNGIIPYNVLSDLEAHIHEFENPYYIISARRAIDARNYVLGRADLALFIEWWFANDERRRRQGRGGGRGGRGRGGKRRTVKKSKRSRRKSRNKRRH
jgi:hypothetical protein